MQSLWVPLIWLLVASGCLGIELVSPSFDGLIFAAISGLIMSALTALLPLQFWLQISLFLLMSILGFFWMKRWSAQRNPRTGRRRLREETAEVLDAIQPGSEGRVRWHGQSWAACSLDVEIVLEPGEKVIVVGRKGTRLQIVPTFPPSR